MTLQTLALHLKNIHLHFFVTLFWTTFFGNFRTDSIRLHLQWNKLQTIDSFVESKLTGYKNRHSNKTSKTKLRSDTICLNLVESFQSEKFHLSSILFNWIFNWKRFFGGRWPWRDWIWNRIKIVLSFSRYSELYVSCIFWLKIFSREIVYPHKPNENYHKLLNVESYLKSKLILIKYSFGQQ